MPTSSTLGDELIGKPFDVWLLERIADLAGTNPIVDVGCGPGHITAFLADTGAQVSGVDLSPGMVEVARREYPDLDFAVGNLFQLLRPRTAAGLGSRAGLVLAGAPGRFGVGRRP